MGWWESAFSVPRGFGGRPCCEWLLLRALYVLGGDVRGQRCGNQAHDLIGLTPLKYQNTNEGIMGTAPTRMTFFLTIDATLGSIR